MSTMKFINQLLRGSSVCLRQVVSCALSCNARVLCAKADLSVLQTVRFPPSKLDFRPILHSIDESAISSEDCEQLHRSIESKQGSSSFWSVLLRTSVELDRPVLAQSVAHFILSNPDRHNHATLVHTLSYLVTQKRFDDFHQLYTVLRSRLSSTELAILAPSLVGLLAQTPEWKQGFNLLPLVESDSSRNLLRKLCDGAVIHGSLADVFSVLNQLIDVDFAPSVDFFELYFKRLFNQPSAVHSDEYVDRLLSFMQRTNWTISYAAAQLIREWFNEKPSWQAQIGVQLQKTECPVCHTRLPAFELTSDSVKSLANEFYERIFKKVDKDELYLTTTPKELNTLDHFLSEQHAPFDCVVDFLNVLHPLGLASDPQRAAPVICDILLRLSRDFNFHRFCLVSKGNKVIRKSTFLKPLRALGNQAGLSIFTFITQQSSEDDVFMLYIALWSGPQCYLVSNDEFKQHRHTVGSDMKARLSRWQAVRQIALHSRNPIQFMNPVKCNSKVHGSMRDGWHIPYEDNSPRRSYVPPNMWLCAMNKPSK